MNRLQMHLHVAFRSATPLDASECVRIRGIARENAVPPHRLARLGITAESWANDIRSGELPGFICTAGTEIAGYCFGSSATGEVIVLAIQPLYERLGIGRQLLNRVVARLHALGHDRLFLGCSSDSSVRSYGFYRDLGWQSTGDIDRYGDEVLQLERQWASNQRDRPSAISSAATACQAARFAAMPARPRSATTANKYKAGSRNMTPSCRIATEKTTRAKAALIAVA